MSFFKNIFKLRTGADNSAGAAEDAEVIVETAGGSEKATVAEAEDNSGVKPATLAHPAAKEKSSRKKITKVLKDTIRDVPKEICTGCGGCYNICPADAISMEYDSDGFLAPVIDDEKCISCGQCLKHCASMFPVYDKSQEPVCYAAYASDARIRMNSSSGGLFSLFALETLKKNGAVVGAAFNEGFLVDQVLIESEEDLQKLRGSKYLQSDSGEIYRKVKKVLDEGRDVLFCGTPCQVGALNRFLDKPYEKLLTIDLMCHGCPSPLLFRKYLAETYPDKKLESFSFRDKSVFGWSTEANAYFTDGTSQHTHRDQDPWYRAFIPCVSVRKACDTCRFAHIPRQGDITLADFWGVAKYNPKFDDGKGTSLVILNSEKGKANYAQIGAKLALNASVPLDYVLKLGQPFDRPFRNHKEHDRFYEMARKNPVKKAINYVKYRKFDIGLLGVWFGTNYGSILTYNALQRKLRDLGASVLMIDKPYRNDNEAGIVDSHTRRFANRHFNISRRYKYPDLWTLNNHCDGFVMGSDQIWNYGIAKNFGRTFYLNFVWDEKKKIAYAASFGHAVDFAPEKQRPIISGLLKRFDAISVREDTGVDIARDVYDVNATQVLDSLFLFERDFYQDIADQSKMDLGGQYLLAYVLDLDEAKRNLLLQLSKKTGLPVKLLLVDAFGCDTKSNLNLAADVFTAILNPEVADFVRAFANASYVVTDSYHGMCFSLMFNRQFIPIMNKRRGYTRFQSMGKVAGIEDRLINHTHVGSALKIWDKKLDYDKINERIDAEREKSVAWLTKAVTGA